MQTYPAPRYATINFGSLSKQLVIGLEQSIDPIALRWILCSIALHAVFLVLQILLHVAGPINPADIPKIAEPFQTRIDHESLKQFAASDLQKVLKDFGALNAGSRSQSPSGPAGEVPKGDSVSSGLLGWLKRPSKNSFFGGLFATQELDQSADRLKRDPRSGMPMTNGREGKTFHDAGPGGGGRVNSAEIGGGGNGPIPGFGPGNSPLPVLGRHAGESRVVPPSLDELEFTGGSLPKDAILRVIQNHLGSIRYCYERRLQLNLDLRGKVVVHFIIGLDGTVTKVSTKKSTVGDSSLDRCVEDVVQKLQFPKPGPGIVEVIFPFLFRMAG